MRSLADFAQPGRQAETLTILLPGALHQPEDFMREGFVDAVRNRGIDMDLLLAGLLFDHVAGEQALPQLHASLIAPSLAAGYRHIWLAGISIGGYVAMAYADRYPGGVEGLFLMAPYPGNRMTTSEIATAGGIIAWQPGDLAKDDTERRNWRWLQSHEKSGIEVHLGYGAEDRFAPGHAMMAEALPARHVDCIAGGHDWPAWRDLWHRFLERRFGGA
jgi:pimeloyl-ACP methyl ester carboxylesterase